MRSLPNLSIVLPAYEEAANLLFLIPQIQKIAASIEPNYEILVIDSEEPRDSTPDICSQYGVRYISRQGGALYGHAIRTAQKTARGSFVICMDADGSHNPSIITKLWENRESSNLVIASRYVQGGKTENPAVLIAMSFFVNVVFRIVLGLKCCDVSNSFRLYKGDDLRSLDLKCDNFDILEEILVKLVVLHPGYRIKEVPFVFEKRKAGKTKRDLVAFAFGYLKTIFRLLQLKYQTRASGS